MTRKLAMETFEGYRRSTWALLIAMGALLSACGGGSDGEAAQDSSSNSVQSEAVADGTEHEAATNDDTEQAVASDDTEAKEGLSGDGTAKVATAQQATAVPVSARPSGFAAKVRLKVPRPGTAASATASEVEIVGVIGGATATEKNVVTVENAEDLKKALCDNERGGICLDRTPRIIKVQGVINLTGTAEGKAEGCYSDKVTCPAPLKPTVTIFPYPKTAEEWKKAHCTSKYKPTYTFTYKKNGLDGLLVGSNKTIVGIGPKSGLKGSGLLLQGNVSNIIIRNLSFTDINDGLVFGGDAIKLFAATGVWIDHNYFARIGRQMISTSASGTKQANSTDITITNNEFDGRDEYSGDCSGRHYYGLLLAGSDRVTIAGNWIHDFNGRYPRLHADDHLSRNHIVNNLFERGSTATHKRAHAIEHYGAQMRVLVEGNYFSDVSDPVDEKQSGSLFGLHAQTDALMQLCMAKINRLCSGNYAAAQDQKPSMTQSTTALAAFFPFRKSNLGQVNNDPFADSLVKAYSAKDVPATVRANAGVGKIKN
jgi:pectin lyase